MGAGQGFPEFRQVVLDSTDARALAEFYRQLLGLTYRPGDEPPAAGEPDPQGRATSLGRRAKPPRWRVRCPGHPHVTCPIDWAGD